jgi:uroporphyrinogen-III synthase
VTAGALAGLTLVVTRPAAQAGPFIALAQAAGAQCIALPTLSIEFLTLPEQQRTALLGTRWDWVIYTSANAVAAAIVQLPGLSCRGIAAVGNATARALAAGGMKVTSVPADGRADSEGLLALQDFAALDGQRVLIVKGVGGRDLLRRELTQRGAEVRTVELYERRLATPAPAALHGLHDALASGCRLAVIATSAEILAALLQLVPSLDADALRAVTLFVPGDRVAAAALQAGWTGRVVTAASAEDHAMLAAVIDAEGQSAGA